MSSEPMSITVAGDYLFTPYTGESSAIGVKWGQVKVYNKATGDSVGSMEPSSVTGQIGLQDIVDDISAIKRSNGEYVVFVEDDWKAKTIMYRWCPGGNCQETGAARPQSERGVGQPTAVAGRLHGAQSRVFRCDGTAAKSGGGLAKGIYVTNGGRSALMRTVLVR
jgi:hypothetical protein